MRLSLIRFGFNLATVALGATLQGCQGGETSRPHIATGTETNWLKTCHHDGDCGALSCECGVCTQRCGENQACALSHAVCSPRDSSALNVLCTRPPTDFGLCLPTCNETCGSGRMCVDGACIPARDAGSSTEPETHDSTAVDPTLSTSDTSVSPTTAPSTNLVSVSSADSGVTSATGESTGPFVDASSTATDGTLLDAGDCTYDSCHPERCDEIGERCCDPYPNDGANYCNAGLECASGACRERANTTTPEALERQSCEATGGEWVVTSCGHYVCGQPPACAAVIPGCNCGPGRSFSALGCEDEQGCPTP